jgi:hypothetical protein
MKYLKLFENNEDIILDKDYIEMCFVDFIDEGNFKFNFQAGGAIERAGGAIEREKTCDITIDMVDSSTNYKWGPKNPSIGEFVKRAEMRSNLFNKIEESLSKIKIEYPTMKHKVMDRTGSDEAVVVISLSISESYIAHNPSGWFPI